MIGTISMGSDDDSEAHASALSFIKLKGLLHAQIDKAWSFALLKHCLFNDVSTNMDGVAQCS